MATLNEWALRIAEWADKKGWWDTEQPRSVGDLIALCHSELSEALEEYRKNPDPTYLYQSEHDNNGLRPGKPEGFGVELVDCIIRIFDMAAHFDIDLDMLMEQKMAYNERRAYRHGGKTI